MYVQIAKKEFSDLARSCPSCGRPTPAIVASIKPPGSNFGVGFLVYLGLFIVGMLLWPFVEGSVGLRLIAALALLSGLLGLLVTACKVIFRLLQRV